MAKEDFIMATDAYFHDPAFFGDDEEHYYDVECHDGYAIGTRCEDRDEDGPEKVKVVYPKLAEVLADENKVSAVLEYRGLYDLTAEDIDYSDIMIYYGRLETI